MILFNGSSVLCRRQNLQLISLCVCSSQDNNEFYTEWEESFDSFDQMQLHENLLRGIYAYGKHHLVAISLLVRVFWCKGSYRSDLLQVLKSRLLFSRKALCRLERA